MPACAEEPLAPQMWKERGVEPGPDALAAMGGADVDGEIVELIADLRQALAF